MIDLTLIVNLTFIAGFASLVIYFVGKKPVFVTTGNKKKASGIDTVSQYFN